MYSCIMLMWAADSFVRIVQHADVYTSRVSNFLTTTPHYYFRSPAQSLAHDRGWSADDHDMSVDVSDQEMAFDLA